MLERNFNIFFKEEIITEENYNEDVKKYLNNNKKGKSFFQIKKKDKIMNLFQKLFKKLMEIKLKLKGLKI